MTKLYEEFKTKPSQMDETSFVECFGGVYEYSPWIATRTWQRGLTTQEDTVIGLSEAMMGVVDVAERDLLMQLINAHPDLAGRAALSGELTEESSAEQSGAGIDNCTVEEFAKFQKYNSQYKNRFGFPFIMAVKESNRHKILAAFSERLEHGTEREFKQAIVEINKIARFRIEVIADQQE